MQDEKTTKSDLIDAGKAVCVAMIANILVDTGYRPVDGALIIFLTILSNKIIDRLCKFCFSFGEKPKFLVQDKISMSFSYCKKNHPSFISLDTRHSKIIHFVLEYWQIMSESLPTDFEEPIKNDDGTFSFKTWPLIIPFCIYKERVFQLIYRDVDFTLCGEETSDLPIILKWLEKCAKNVNPKFVYCTKTVKSLVMKQEDHPDVPLWQDRNFDNLVSKQKYKIITLLDQFLAPKNPSALVVQHNIGLMFYGPPGTGKTSFVKAICNYLKRNAKIVSMDDIKTKHDFEQLFEQGQLSSYVYVLDEFDRVGGVLMEKTSSDDYKKDEKSVDSKISKLETERTQYLTSSNISTKAEKRLESIEQEIKDLKSKINLKTMLEVLDGSCEMRGRVIVACTNHPELISNALKRPGRFTMVELSYFDDMEIKEYISRVFEPILGKDLVSKRLEKITCKEKTFSPAELSNLCAMEMYDPNGFEKVLKIVST